MLYNMQPDGEVTGGLNNYDDELCLVCVSFIELHTGLPMLLQSPPRPLTKRMRAESEDDNATDPEPKRPRVKSNSSTGSSTAKRNAEAGGRIALSFNKLSETMAKPIVTTTDISYVDDVMRVLEDETLLPIRPTQQAIQHCLHLPHRVSHPGPSLCYHPKRRTPQRHDCRNS
jgi:hypothetical protein